MSNIPADLRYSKEDEWIKTDGDIVTIGITDYAQDALSDIVYLELPAVGDSFVAGDIFGVVESVKAASDLFTPLSLEITEVNEALIDAPESLNDDPYGAAWMIKGKMQDQREVNGLLDADAYQAWCEERS